jgi:hypothetical protein
VHQHTLRKRHFFHPERGMKLGLEKREKKKKGTKGTGALTGCFSARILSFCKITYELGYLLQKENTN